MTTAALQKAESAVRDVDSRLRYLVARLRQLPADIDWLTPAEKARLEAFRFEKRRSDWLLGRWTAKQALLAMRGLPDSEIRRFEIESAPNGAPLPMMDGRPCEARLSLSHSNGHALCVVAGGTAALGCDIERVEPRGAEFVETWFTSAEQQQVERTDPAFKAALVTLIWSAKESTLKAMRTGLNADTRSVSVVVDPRPATSGWQFARTVLDDGGEFGCLWCVAGPFVLTIVTSGALEAPCSLSEPADSLLS